MVEYKRGEDIESFRFLCMVCQVHERNVDKETEEMVTNHFSKLQLIGIESHIGDLDRRSKNELPVYIFSP